MPRKITELGTKPIDFYVHHNKCTILERFFWNNPDVVLPTRVLNSLYDLKFRTNNEIRHNQIKLLISENDLRKLHPTEPVSCQISSDYYAE